MPSFPRAVRKRHPVAILAAGALCLLAGSCTDSPPEAKTSSTQQLTSEVSGSVAPTDSDTEQASITESTDFQSTDAPVAKRVDENPGLDTGSNWLGHGEMDEEKVELAWSPVDRADTYQIHRHITGIDVDTAELDDSNLVYRGPETQFVDATVEPNNFYTYFLVVEIDGEFGGRRWTQTLTVTDTEPPTKITGLTAERTNDGILLTWDQSSDNVEFASYAVKSVKLSTDGEEQLTYIGGGADLPQTSFLDTKPPDGSATYSVEAVDFHDNRSEPTRIVVD